MQLFFYALNFFLVVIEVICMTHLANSFFEKKGSSKGYIIKTLAYVVLANIPLLFLANNLILKLLGVLLAALVWLLMSYKTNLIRSLFVSVFWLSYITIIDSLFIVSSSFFIPENSASLLSDPFAYYLLCYSAKIFELFTVVLIHTWAKTHFRSQYLSRTDWLRILFFPSAAVATTFSLVHILYLEPHLAKELFLCQVILLFSDLMSILLLNYLDSQRLTALENTILRQNLKLEHEHIASLKDAYAEQRKQTHDFQNQLAVLHGLSKHNASQKEFAEYLEKTLSFSFPATIYINTNRLVVDIILSQRYSAAKNKGITFRTALTDLSDFPLPDDALVVVLTNLIDNAIEACEKLPEDKRSILLKMQNTDDSAIIYIENPTLHPVKIRNNRIMTTKPNPIEHGYGLKNVCTLLDQHNADYAMNYNASTSVFCFSAQITY